MSTSSPASLPAVVRRPGEPPVLCVDPAPDPVAWALAHREAVRAAVLERGALLIRGLNPNGTSEAQGVFAQLASELMTEREPFAPRASYGDRIYSATKWPPNQPMCMHHELSYAAEFPGLMMFACLLPSRDEGATTVADSTAVLRALPSELVQRFAREGWLLVRNYNEDVGASVLDAFGTEDRVEVEAYCRANAIEFRWQPDGGLRTWQRRCAVLRHPASGVPCWFNQIAFLNEWTIDPEIREYLVDMYGADGLPFNTRFGSGAPIGEDVVRAINDVYTAHTLRAPWQIGDLLLVDNIRTAHAREPFAGPREVRAALADPVRLVGDPGRGGRAEPVRMNVQYPTAE